MFNRKIKKSFRNVKKDIDKLNKRITSLETKPFTLWFTGRPCSGKTTVCLEVEKELKKKNYSIVHLDGDILRKGINSDLKFSKKDRDENLRRIAHICELFNQKGLIVLASFVSPLKNQRKNIKEIISNFNLVYVNAPLEECIKRDVKGMYNLAKKGKIKDFTGISSPFEEPLNPNLTLYTKKETLEESIKKVIEKFF